MASSVATADNRFDVAAFIDAQAIGGREIAMLAVCSIVLFIDGFDMYFLGKIAPAVASGLGGKPADMTQVFTWQQTGMFAGAFLMPYLADRKGRGRCCRCACSASACCRCSARLPRRSGNWRCCAGSPACSLPEPSRSA
jgi:AAHS family 4-hydroxybenzoate transporter-like MFS transporter